MKHSFLFLVLLLVTSCYIEDDSTPIFVDPIFVENPTSKLLVDIVYVLPSEDKSSSIYGIDETQYLEFLNGSYFHRYNIGLELGDSKTIINSALYDLKDDRNKEVIVFNTETKNSYKQDRLTIYIIPRSNTVSIAGIGLPQRALITDEFLYKSTSAHEIGHALGLEHSDIEGNIMSEIKPYLRKEFDENQIETMIEKISTLNSIDQEPRDSK